MRRPVATRQLAVTRGARAGSVLVRGWERLRLPLWGAAWGGRTSIGSREPGPGCVRAVGAVGRAPARCRERGLMSPILPILLELPELLLTIEVSFSPLDGEEGFDDDIRFRLSESGPAKTRLLRTDSASFLLTPDQADQLGRALLSAARKRRRTPR